MYPNYDRNLNGKQQFDNDSPKQEPVNQYN